MAAAERLARRVGGEPREATPGPWEVKVSPDGGIAIATDGFSFSQEERAGDADYIAAADPATLLALIAEVRRMRMALLIERGSLGTPEARALRESVNAEQVAAVLARVRDMRDVDGGDH